MLSAARHDPAAVPVRYLAATASGTGRGKLRGPGWRRLSRGLYAPASDPVDLRHRAAALALVLPRSSGFGHLTSAALRGWWLPNRLDTGSLAFASTSSQVHVQRCGLYVRRSSYTQVEDVTGLPLVSAPETLLELAQDLSLIDLVPLLDCALAAGTSAADILAAARPRARGARALRKALTLADPLSESWWESVLRLLHVVAGLGPVKCQAELFDDGVFVARADLHLVGTNRYPECDGGEHRTPERHRRDLRRERALSRMEAERWGYTTAEIAHSPAVIIADAEGARGLPRDPARLARWWGLAQHSTLTGHGRARLQSRLVRYRRAASR